MKKIILTITLTVFVFLTVGNTGVYAQKTSSSNSKAAIFKIPDGVLPMDWNKNGYKGFLMLDAKNPAGIFITYPNEGEDIEALKKRILKTLFPMVNSDEEEKELKDSEIKWQISDIPNHKGDNRELAKYYIFEGEKKSTQVLMYEREGSGKTFVYGYFATKTKDGKSSDKIWADEKGNGVKLFKKFWKSLS